MKIIVRAFVACLFASAACAQSVSPVPLGPGSGGGGGGGGGGSVTLNTTCPTSTTTGTTLNLAGGVFPVSRSPISGASDTLLAGDCNGSILYTGTPTVTVPQAGSVGFLKGYIVQIVMGSGAGTGTFNTTTSVFTANGTSSITLAAGKSMTLQSGENGNWNVYLGAASGGTLTLAGSSGAIQTNNGSGNLGSITPGTNVAGALANNTEATGSFVRQNGAIPAGDLLQESSTGAQDSGVAGALVAPAYTRATSGNGFYFPLFPGYVIAAGTTGPAQNSMRCSPFYLPLAEHWDSLSLDVSTLGTGPLTFALYADALDATTHRHQPQTVLAGGNATGSFTVTGTGVQTVTLGVANTGYAIPQGLNWVCTNDTTSGDLVRFYTATATTGAGALIGTSTVANATSNTPVSGLSIAATSGTWASQAGQTFAEFTGSLTIAFGAHVVSTP